MSGNAAGTIAKVGIPLALTAMTGGAAAPLAAASEGMLSPVAAGALVGAATGAAGSALTGGNPLTGAALGGIGGGIGQTGMAKDLMSGTNSASDANNISDAAANGAAQGVNQSIPTAFAPLASTASDAATPSASGGIGSMLARNALPIAGGLAVLATSNNGKPQAMTVQGNGFQPNNVDPLQRTQLATDPNAYYGVGGARQAFDVVNPSIHTTPQHFANGGSALYQKAKGPSSFKQGAFHLAAGGMPQMPQAPQGIGSMVNGVGDGQSDQIPAMLSDGEYVVPAPVVSAIGRGSNNAGAKKLDKMKHSVMKKTYKGAKPPAAGLGIGAMRTA